MSEHPGSKKLTGFPGDHSGDDEENLERLRQLILGPERAQLEKIEERLGNPDLVARDVSSVLPQAIKLSSARDRKLIEALKPTLVEVLDASVKKDQSALVNALFPLMGPAIRKYIGEKFQDMVYSLSRTLEKSLSLKGLVWRLEALRSGRSFAEVALLHSLLYQVEQIFLIHRETGLVLKHLVAPEVNSLDADIVSGMLTAIQDFVRDSFGGQEGESLSTLQYGHLTIWIEQGPQAVLAGVVSGNAPPELKLTFQNAIEAIHLEKADSLLDFEGDASDFDDIEPYVDACLTRHYVTEKKGTSPLVWLPVALAALALAVWIFFAVRDHYRWADYLNRLESEPGIVVVSTGNQDGKYYITGLRDPLAVDPASILAQTALDPGEVAGRWEPYYSLSDALTLKRAQNALNPPQTVTLAVENGRLIARGQALPEWVATARSKALSIPGVSGFDGRELNGDKDPWGDLLKKMDDQPGLVVVSSTVGEGRFFISGLRDPLSMDPERLIKETGLDPGKIVSRFEPYQSLDREIVLQRVAQILNPPATVTLTYNGGVLIAKGKAPRGWVRAAREKVNKIAGVLDYNDRDLVAEELKRFDLVKKSVEEGVIHFVVGSSRIVPEDEKIMEKMARQIKELQDLSGVLGGKLVIEIVGRTDTTGSEAKNMDLSQQRASRIRSILVSQGVNWSNISAFGVGISQPLADERKTGDTPENRSVTFRVVRE